MTDAPIDKSSCTRCGTCCKKGGPAIHKEDRFLIESGIILLKHLYTIREGEPAHDNLTNEIRPCMTDIIKIRSAEESTTCIFYNENGSSCTIYENRPSECRALQCWDTRKIEVMYNQNRLTRQDVMGDIEGLWELVSDHQKRCSFGDVMALAEKMNKKKERDPILEEKVRYVIQYDHQIRSLVKEKGQIDPEMIDFLFGRPLIDTVKSLGMTARFQNGKITLSSAI